jgi:long-chain acyl-CoA synthetase
VSLTAADAPCAERVDASTLLQLLLDRVERQPGSVALRVKRLGLWQEVTWAAHGREVRDLALGLAAAGVEAGDAVAVLAEATPEALALDLAIQALGAATLPLNPSSSAADLRRLLDEAGVEVIVIGDLETVDRLGAATELDGSGVRTAVIVEGSPFRSVRDWTLVTFAELLARADGTRELADLAAGRRADEPMSLHPTAGTSGHPRLARISSAGLVAAWSEFLATFAPGPADTFVVEAPISHVSGRAAVLLLPLLHGAVAHFPEHPAAVDEAMADVSPTLSVALPERWEGRAADLRARVSESGRLHRWAYRAGMRARRGPGALLGRWLVLHPVQRKLGLRRLRAAAVGGRYVPADLLEFWRAAGVPLVEFYGLTEAGGLVAFQSEPSPAGTGLRPHTGLSVRIGEGGEVEVAGPGLAAGGWLPTGDRGRLAEDGSLGLSHRVTDVITLDGREVPIGEIERTLRAQGHIRHVAVVGQDRPFLAALIELDLPSVAAWARSSSVRYGSLGSLAENPRVLELVRSAVEAANADLAERGLPAVREFTVLRATESFEATDVLALTGEVRRGEVASRYAAHIEDLYAAR